MSEHVTASPRSEQQQVEYRDIPGFPGYRVGDDGSVWTRWVRYRDGHRAVLGEIWHKRAIIYHCDRGYVKLSRNRVITTHSVSRLVLESFVGPCPIGMEACHFPDRSPRNNSLSNLRWDTRESNHADKNIHGTMVKGEKSFSAKLTEADVSEIRKLAAAGVRQKLIAKRFGVNQTNVSFIVRRKTWKHVT